MKKKYKKQGKYSLTGHTNYVTQNIIKLIEVRKIKQAKRIINEELKISPKDKYLKSLLLHCYLLEKNYEEILNYPEELEEEDLIKITIAAMKLQDEDKLRYLYEKYYIKDEKVSTNKKIDIQSYNILKYYLLKRFSPTININVHELSYKERMLWEYIEKEAINYIKTNYCDLYSTRDIYFSPTINLEELFNLVKESIPQNKGKETVGKLGESYIFYYPGCGYTKKENNECDYLIVSTTFNTTDIFSMRPGLAQEKEYYSGISEFISSKQKTESPKRRTRTGLERFNDRYNRK